MAYTRRRFIKAAGAGIGASALGFPAIVRAQGDTIRLGLMTVKTGPLASGGLDMERALIKNPVYSRDWPPAKNLES